MLSARGTMSRLSRRAFQEPRNAWLLSYKCCSSQSIRGQIHDDERSGLKDMLIYSSVINVSKYKHQKKLAEKAKKSSIFALPQASETSWKMRNHTSKMVGSVDAPVAMQFMLDNPLPEVQREGSSDQEITVEDVSISPGRSEGSAPMSAKPIFPFAIYDDPFTDQNKSKTEHLATDLRKSDESTEECVKRGRVLRRPRRGRRGGVDVEDSNSKVEYEVITDNLEPEEVIDRLSADEFYRFGTADKSVSAGKIDCSGCGARLHCHDPQMPGFIPVEILKGSKELNLRCQRCYVMAKYDVALKVSVSPEDYPKTLAHIYDRKAIVLLVVDLLDFPGSVWPGIIDLLGVNKHIVIIGNKADLLPQDSQKYLKQVEDSMRQSFRKKCLANGIKPPRLDSCLISAKTGFNIEGLIDKVYRLWQGSGNGDRSQFLNGRDVYIVGTTNVGKSSLFNILLDSDLCSIGAVNRVEKAMTSPVPGTTLNLLKFPMSRPDPSRMADRKLRLKKDREVWNTEERVRIAELRRTHKRELTLISQPVRRTIEVVSSSQASSDPGQGGQKKFTEDAPKYTFDFDTNSQKKDDDFLPVDPTGNSFRHMKWCHDTPGTISSDQIINLLTQPEISLALQTELPLRPRTYHLYEGQSLFIAGLARFDVIKAPSRRFNSMDVTVFTSDRLPIHIVRTEDAEDFYDKALVSNLLKVPSLIGDEDNDFNPEDRLRDFPALEYQDFQVDGVSAWESACDVVLSSAGWISCNPGVAQVFDVRGWTPGGKGLFLREMAFLPKAVNLKGKKIKKTQTYQNDGIYGIKRPEFRDDP